ncbi:MAG: ribosomal protein S18-alanine N-acetyltransferase [Maricaulis sp.]|uniref:ribosomal protein S18-alanine N-acetyltransferase n=1 Tax=Maricaulis sp. TaxID=1486257 RepID=UPI001B2F0B28|nr:ribosomal protein S18-alanine N-acetyltransferase [Maricaulis sp.]MBO6728830.1 ribosomal protein S18-alanine N-acetyltransferase [Maricaulis sp.]MBO6846177.1 ribosomal protein S18-alanine N-acetyltransferase [Maricaulis sp.]MBO6875946.1 ribosomal protein S18-alanine N-acetyltransferase [Maricaulis sp.]
MIAEEVTAQSAERMAALHAKCFDQPWPASEFASLLSMPSTLAFAIQQDARHLALVLVRIAADEAEILTIGVDPDFRGKRLGLAVLDRAERAVSESGAISMFLEVNQHNDPARALYTRAGYSEIGRRPRYYRGRDDALIFRKSLLERGQTGA